MNKLFPYLLKTNKTKTVSDGIERLYSIIEVYINQKLLFNQIEITVLKIGIKLIFLNENREIFFG